ncbi:MAG: choice-of-anchor G family protein, partial [Yaniella sp.]|nr:choice-of-anchor G family protein [Yaniella sp.]
MTLGGATAAVADEESPRSYAEGHLIDLDLLGLDELANVGVAEQTFDRDNDPVTGTINADVLGQLVNLDLGAIGLELLPQDLDAGLVNSYAHADSPANPLGAAGLVGADGSVGVGLGEENPNDFARVDLTGALDSLGLPLDGVVDQLGLELGAIGSQATGSDDGSGQIESDYTIAGAELVLDAPGVGNVSNLLYDTVGGLENVVGGLIGPESVLQGTLDAVSVNPIRIPLLANIDLGSPQLQAEIGLTDTLDGLLTEELVSESGLTTIDLSNGRILVDLAQLHEGNLNNLPPNTPLIDSEQVQQISTEITGLLSELLDEVTSEVEDLLAATKVTVELQPELSVLLGLASSDIGLSIEMTLAELLGGVEDVDRDNVIVTGDLSIGGLITLPVGT